MYYISHKVDTEDGKTEFYTPAQISNFVNKGINVIMIFLLVFLIILKMIKLLMMN